MLKLLIGSLILSGCAPQPTRPGAYYPSTYGIGSSAKQYFVLGGSGPVPVLQQGNLLIPIGDRYGPSMWLQQGNLILPIGGMKGY